LIALLEGAGFESFTETDDELVAYIASKDYDQERVSNVLASVDQELTFNVIQQPDRNWNAEWEKNYPPVIISGKCYVRAPFHPERKDVPVEIVIQPQMAFGTAHHETTALMIEWMLEMDVAGKRVLDMGCGTGVLAILANKLGASGVMAVDNDIWAYRNTLDNIRSNNAMAIHVLHNDVSSIRGEKFDMILANITRNILAKDLPDYCRSLQPGGLCILSGFHENDISIINDLALQLGLVNCGVKTHSGWSALCFRMFE
jgi:ribosomal protein L11 methyltransferase